MSTPSSTNLFNLWNRFKCVNLFLLGLKFVPDYRSVGPSKSSVSSTVLIDDRHAVSCSFNPTLCLLTGVYRYRSFYMCFG